MREAIKICQIQYFEADFLLKISLKILNSEINLKTITLVLKKYYLQVVSSLYKKKKCMLSQLHFSLEFLYLSS